MYNQPLADSSLIGCPECDLLQHLPTLAPGESARCPRCHALLLRRHPPSLDRPLALTITAACLYLIANAVPMLGLTLAGRKSFTTVIGGAEHLWHSGFQEVALLVLFAVVLAPAVQIGSMLVILLAARRTKAPNWVAPLLRYYPSASIWSMIEVMLLGVLISLIKIAEYAQVIPGIALFALGSLVFVVAAVESSVDLGDLWERVEWAHDADMRQADRGATEEATS